MSIMGTCPKCGAVLSAVTGECVRGVHCKPRAPLKKEHAMLEAALIALEPFASMLDDCPKDRTWGMHPVANHYIRRADETCAAIRAALGVDT